MCNLSGPEVTPLLFTESGLWEFTGKVKSNVRGSAFQNLSLPILLVTTF
jgi:hypothetical protein